MDTAVTPRGRDATAKNLPPHARGQNQPPKPKAATPTTKPKRKEKRAPFEPVGKHVVHEVSVRLCTEAASRVFDTTMEPMRTATFLLEDSLPRRARDEMQPIDELLDVIDAKFAAAEKAIDGEVARLEAVAKDLGCALPKRYTHADVTLAVHGFSPTFFRFVDLVLKLDIAMQWLDSLWMARSIHTKDRGETIVRSRNLVLHLSREMQNIKLRATTAVEKIEADRGRKMAARAAKQAVKDAAAELRRQERKRNARKIEASASPDDAVGVSAGDAPAAVLPSERVIVAEREVAIAG